VADQPVGASHYPTSSHHQRSGGDAEPSQREDLFASAGGCGAGSAGWAPLAPFAGGRAGGISVRGTPASRAKLSAIAGGSPGNCGAFGLAWGDGGVPRWGACPTGGGGGMAGPFGRAI